VGKNKLAKFEEMKTFEHVVHAPYNTLKNNDFHLKGKWRQDFFNNRNPLILELGCGKGEYSVELSEKNPDKNFIGVDIKGARLWKGAKTARDKKLANVAFLRTNIEIINQFFGQDEVDEIWLTFPDPQMKKTRKRLTSAFFLNKYRQFLKKEGIIHLKTDSNFQFSYTSALVHLNGFEIIAETPDLYASEILNETLQIKTFYEKQWLSRGITIKYLAFKLNEKELLEPETDIEKDEYRSFGRSARDIH
jgi:tRNA (guanine-N7-)-methyltransferase